MNKATLKINATLSHNYPDVMKKINSIGRNVHEGAMWIERSSKMIPNETITQEGINKIMDNGFNKIETGLAKLFAFRECLETIDMTTEERLYLIDRMDKILDKAMDALK